MPDLLHWTTFLTATIVLLLIPGPSVMYVVARGVEHGYRGVIFSAIGLALGDLLQVLCTVIGISTLLASSAVMFSLVKFVGATYLIGLGLYRLIARSTNSSLALAAQDSNQNRSRSLMMQAFFALNPKTAIFFLALFPQFVARSARPAWLQILLFGCAFVLLGFVTNSLYGLLAGTLSTIGKESRYFERATRYLTGVVLIGMGIAAAWG